MTVENYYDMYPEKLYVRKAQDLPGVSFDKDLNVFEMTGRSFPANAGEFYQPLLLWLDAYKNSKPESMSFDFRIEYFNTASAKMLLDLFFKLEEILRAGTAVVIKWYYLDDDEDMLEAGEEFNDMVEIEFEFVEFTEDDI